MYKICCSTNKKDGSGMCANISDDTVEAEKLYLPVAIKATQSYWCL